MKANRHLRISIITPVYNQAEFLERTINSVLEQAYPNLEYIVIDGGSDDGTVEIIKKYADHLSHWVSEPDEGMYDALNKGFEQSTGEIMGWINADDVLMPNSLESLNKVFTNNSKINWIQGQHSLVDLDDNIIGVKDPRPLTKIKFLTGDYKWIQQESSYWRRNLWDRSGATLDGRYKLAGDFELWFRFFDFDYLFYLNQPIGAWRRRTGQLSEQIDLYEAEVNSIIKDHKLSPSEKVQLKRISLYKRLSKFLNRIGISASFFEKKVDRILNRQAKTVEV